MTDPVDRIRPPGLTRAILAAVLPAVEGDAILGDLEEGFCRRAATNPRGANWWYRREAAAYALRVGLPHLRASFTQASPFAMTADLRFAVRRLVRQPGLTLVMLITLGLGIGANATIFSVVDAVLFRPLPVGESDRIVEIYGSSERDANAGGMFQGFLPVSYPNFEDIRDGSSTTDGMFVYSQWPVSATLGEESERIQALYVSASYFDVLGVATVTGRAFRPDEDLRPGADAYVVLQHGYWERQFGADPSVVGRTLTVNARPLEVIGVAPPAFRGTSSTSEPDVFIPVSMIGDVPPWGQLWTRRGLRFFNAGARIAPGRTLADVRAEMASLAMSQAEAYPETNRTRGLQVLPLAEARVNPNNRTVLSRTGAVLLVMAGLVLLIACMNVANLLLTRALSQRGELAVRTSLGATRSHLIRQMAVEAGMLFVAGAGLGIAGAVTVLGFMDGVRPPAFNGGSLDVGLDLRVLVVTSTIVLVCALLFGVGPSVRAAHVPAAQSFRSRRSGGERLGRRLRELLVMGQVALSVVALAGAGMFMQSLNSARAVDPGFDVDGLGMMSVDLAAQGYDTEEGRAFYRRMLESAEGVPDVEAAAIGGFRPLTPAPLRRVTRVDQVQDQPDVGHYVRVVPVSGDYFATLDIGVEEGRPLGEGDRADTRMVAVPNRSLVRLLWPDGDALGQRFNLSLVDDPLEVVGVASTTKTVTLSEEDQPVLYVPLEQADVPSAVLFVRLKTSAGLEEVRQQVQALDPSLPVFDLTTADALLSLDLWTARATARVLGVFGLVGLLLAGVGIYGVVSYGVRERTREMGLRIALGAGRTRVLGSAVGRVMAVAGAGATLGVVGAVVVVGAFAEILFDVNPGDPLTLGGVAAGLLAVSAFAAWVPARRATRVDPMVVLKGE